MKYKLIVTSILLTCLFACKNTKDRITDLNVIDIEYGMENLTGLKVSDFGKSIRYIPLETTDDCLVGDVPIIKVLKNYIVIENPERHGYNCLLFDKKDGRFIAEIGSRGQGPAEFSSNFSWTDEKEEFLYFIRQSNQLLKYDMKGTFSGNISFSTPPGLASYYVLTESEIIGYFTGLGQMNEFSLGFFDKEGNLNDTIPTLYPRKIISNPDEIANFSLFRGRSGFDSYGIWADGGLYIIGYKNGQLQIIPERNARIWKHHDHIRFKEDFIDTIYTVSNTQLIPSIVFNTGKYHLPVAEATMRDLSNDRIFIADVSENNTVVFFQCLHGWNVNTRAEKHGLYTGLFDKKTGEVKIGKNSDGIEDDLTQFMPFSPMGMSTSGEFISLIESYKVMDWLEKHPEARNNDKLSFLATLDEEANPIVILIE